MLDAMLMDHGTPWWNWQSFSGRTQLSLWMMRQGIRLCWSGMEASKESRKRGWTPIVRSTTRCVRMKRWG